MEYIPARHAAKAGMRYPARVLASHEYGMSLELDCSALAPGRSPTLSAYLQWANTVAPEIAQDSHSYIRSEIAKLYDDKIAAEIIIQYGGSMNAANSAELLAQADIDGGFIGGAALDANAFTALIDAAAKR